MKATLLKSRRMLLASLVLPLGLWSIVTIHFQAELFPIFPQHLPSVRGLELFQDLFASGREVAVVIRSPQGAATPAVGGLESHLRRMPGVESVVRLGSSLPVPPQQFAAWLIATLPPEQFVSFQDRLTREEMDRRLEETLQRLSGAIDEAEIMRLQFDPLRLSERLEATGVAIPDFSRVRPPRPGPVTILMVRSSAPLSTFQQCQSFTSAVRQVVSKHARDSLSGSEVYLTGRPAFVAETSLQMKQDMIRMIVLAIILVSAVFWLFYRSLRALFSIIFLQAIAMLSGVIAARVVFGELNVLSMGFASIILGVGMDYCILVYHNRAGIADQGGDVWRTLTRSIWLSAVTTAASFGILFFSSFPGFKQLAVLVAVGLLVTALLATGLLPVILSRAQSVIPPWIHRTSGRAAWEIRNHRWLIRWAVILGAVLLVWLWPYYKDYSFYDASLTRLQPSQSEAARGQQLMLKARSSSADEMLILQAASWTEVSRQARAIAERTGLKGPLWALWLDPELKAPLPNRKRWTAGKRVLFEQACQQAGLDRSWQESTGRVFDLLDRWHAGTDSFAGIRSFTAGFAAVRGADTYLLLQLPRSLAGQPVSSSEFWDAMEKLSPSALPVSWELLKGELSRAAETDFRRLSGWMLAIIILLCWIAHRRVRLVGLNLAALAMALAILGLFLFLTRTSMSLLSLLAVPLLIGLVIDYSLHLLLVLEKHDGDLNETFRHLAVPVCLTGLTSMIGFGSPMITRQPALQNFGFIMDLGILSAVLTGLVILPAFYYRNQQKLSYSRLLYRVSLLESATRLAGKLGISGSRRIAGALGTAYAVFHPLKRRQVRRNLSLLSGGNVSRRMVRRVFTNYAVTLADYFALGRTSPQRALEMIEQKEGIEHLRKVHAEGRGGMIVTAHLGLFELGGLLLTDYGFSTAVLTLPEPSLELTEWRARYRKRWGIDTLEVGENDFSFVKIIQTIRKGGFVAALADRPYERNRVSVDFPNGPIPFSTGPVLIALLAKCPIIPGGIVLLPSGGYRMQACPPIYPEWMEQGREETLRHYTVEIARALTPFLCQHPDQWYQFGPLSE